MLPPFCLLLVSYTIELLQDCYKLVKFLLNVSSSITSIITSFFTGLLKTNNMACRENDQPGDEGLQYRLCIYSREHRT